MYSLNFLSFMKPEVHLLTSSQGPAKEPHPEPVEISKPLARTSSLQFALLLSSPSGHVHSGFRTENLHDYFCNTPSPCTPLLPNNPINKAHKLTGHKYTYYSNSVTCFGILCRLLGNQCMSHLSHSVSSIQFLLVARP
jgi:hypothetical protein